MPAAPPPCLLLVEDNHDDIIFMEQAFRDAGLSCPHRVLSDGLEVIDYLSEEDYERVAGRMTFEECDDDDDDDDE